SRAKQIARRSKSFWTARRRQPMQPEPRGPINFNLASPNRLDPANWVAHLRRDEDGLMEDWRNFSLRRFGGPGRSVGSLTVEELKANVNLVTWARQSAQ